MTLVELVLALAITGLIGAAIASMLTAVAYGSSSSQDLRRLVVQGKTLGDRLDAAVRAATLVLNADGSHLVLWTHDRDGNHAPSLHELRRIEHDPDAATLTAYSAAEDAPDLPYTLDHDFTGLTSALIATGHLVPEVWGTGVSGCTFATDENDAQDARLVSYRLTLGAGAATETVVGAAALRN